MDNLLVLSGYQIKLLLRNVKSVILGFTLPIAMFFIFSNLLSGYTVDGQMALTNLLVPAYIPIIIVNGVMVIFGQNFIVYKEQGNLLKFKLLGISGLTVSASLYIATFIFQLVASLLLVVFASVLKNISIPFENVPNVIIVFLIINMYQFAITYFLTAFINKSVTYQSVSLLIFYFQIFLGGLTFPPEMFPTFLKNLVYLFNPIIYGLTMMRGVWSTNDSVLDYPKEIMILVGVSIVLITLGMAIQKKLKK
ncbi:MULTISPECIES: ABC transporter permease [unclassified Bacillus cereus group]|uniref:ABC transporter permease n=1 Tax=unclassified Bacillus cereus group TaxID=2750818 RepID=UPI001F5A7EDF|nr:MULTISPECIES: ABC transporter permease [unclassified Bacillus cereus group]